MPDTTTLPPRLQAYVDELAGLDKLTRTMLLLEYADQLGEYPEALKQDALLVPGCVSRVWLDAACQDGRMRYRAAAEGQIAQGMVAMLINGLNDETPETVLNVDPAFIREAGLAEALTAARQGGLASMLKRMQQEAARLTKG
jgi:cysteine desulfuration protein SufE